MKTTPKPFNPRLNEATREALTEMEDTVKRLRATKDAGAGGLSPLGFAFVVIRTLLKQSNETMHKLLGVMRQAAVQDDE